MKEAIIALILSSLVLGGVGFITTPEGGRGSWSEDHSERMEGRESSYDDSTRREAMEGPMQVRVLSKDPTTAYYIRFDFEYEYRLDHRVDDETVVSLIEDRQDYLSDALHVELSSEEADELITGPGKYRLKRRLRDLVQRSLFAEDEARVENILFKSILVQPTRN